ncbi:hypothetical protein PGN35_026140 [Nodosilinea sp. PGN35]|uniref:hypothetical protein n=1 Tax=Nodosilinea sp. PGN35 TaxID=3020489 RepID=UPI0023B28707|nr:hypothetical protein [Nodosilinea sp. TSF1-S3]MDF0367280.1 hypothetical protein [Nodosilinea sp. TSF1-S3]
MNYLFSALRTSLSVVKAVATGLGQLLVLGALAGVLWGSTLGVSPAYAANPGAKPNEAGPVRQSYNPISQENFSGGVDRAAAERNLGHSPSAPEPETGLVDALKNLLPGSESGAAPASPRSDIQPEKNPTLERYGNSNQN